MRQKAKQSDAIVIHFSPAGRVLDHQGVSYLSDKKNLILVSSRYEGVDERFVRQCVDEEWSIGNYVLSGGELPAMVLMDAIVRQLPNALGNSNSANEDSFVNGLLDHEHYTRPEDYNGELVPSVLKSGNHEEIKKWRLENAKSRTLNRRPDLIKNQN